MDYQKKVDQMKCLIMDLKIVEKYLVTDEDDVSVKMASVRKWMLIWEKIFESNDAKEKTRELGNENIREY
ncbi:MAG: hypothetical protein KGZ39_00200 [Simkania sp.]|nr:hypothetical protein [Simkania sp.]